MPHAHRTPQLPGLLLCCFVPMTWTACAGAPQRGGAFAEEVTSWVRPDGEAESFRFRLLRPDGVAEDPGLVPARWPLVVFLHGAGERGDDNASHLAHFPELFEEAGMRERFPCYVLAVQCRPNARWSDVDWSSPQPEPMADEPTLDLARVEHAMRRVMAQEPVDPERVYLTGLSMGGYGAFDFAPRCGEIFAAVVAICGGGDPVAAPLMAHIPFWVWHGVDDPVVPVVRSELMVDALLRAGGRPRWTPLDGVGHRSWDAAYGEEGALEWMFTQRRSQH